MSSNATRFDVAVVGASLAGCSAAIHYARRGLRVALIERNPDMGAYKKVCTHFIQPSATPALERLGLAERIERAGGVRNGAEIWTRWGWIRPADLPAEPRPYGYNIRRQVLDPMLRRMAVALSGVEFLPGRTARELLHEDGRVAGVRVQSSDGRTLEVRAHLVVGADGRNSRIAQLAGVPTEVKPHGRFAYFAHFRDLPLASGTNSQLWMLDPDTAYAFPNDDGITVLAVMPHRDRLDEFKRNLEPSFFRSFAALPDAPELSRAKQVTGIMGMLDMPNLSRPAAGRGVALVGDAAQASDPLWGVGCGWAFQSAEWLAEATADALQEGEPTRVDRALQRYRKQHHSLLAGHHSVICDFATGRPFNLIERLFFPAAVRDPVTARHFEAFGSRRITPRQFLSPAAMLRAAWVNLTHRERRRAPEPVLARA